MTFGHIILLALALIAVVLLYHYGGCEPGKIQAMPWLECER